MDFLYIAWLNVLVSVAGSLFFSEVLKYPPCTLCWYQRICMFPLAVILGIGLAKKIKECFVFSVPFAALGWIISFYHNLLYYKILQTEIVPCGSGTSCTEKQLELFGFMTIPLMSLIAFSITLVLFFLHHKNRRVSS